jgi:pimeloyl-ACP methyl ester carboxylesterase
MLRANGVDLCVETFGDPGSPAVLLIGGAANSMDWWEDEFCERLAAGPRFVIRYDLRDTGQSVSYEPGAPRYGGPDLVADAVGLLDELGIARAHLVGISMGGGIAQRVALDHPGRVASLTLMSTSPGGPGGPDSPKLPPMSEELASFFADPPPPPDWSDRAAVIDYIVEGLRPFEGSIPFDEAGVRELVARIVDRTSNIESTLTNHWILESGEPGPPLGEIEAPTLVLHGTEDPLFPYGHAEALAAEIPGARLLPLEGMGHQLPPRPLWDRVVGAILKHTSAARGQASA